MTLAGGDDFVSGSLLSYQEGNRIKDNWRGASAPTSPQAGMLWSDSNDEKLYHRQASAWKEIVQVDTEIAGYIDLVRISTLAAGGFGFRIDAYQDDTTALTGLLRGAYIQASNGDETCTGTIRALELKARAGRPGETGANVAVLEGLSISADAKTYDITTVMRGAEVILDGASGSTVTKAVGIRIAQNFQADIATLCYGLEFYRDSFDYDADIALSSGGLIGGSGGHLLITNAGVITISGATTINDDLKVGSRVTMGGGANDHGIVFGSLGTATRGIDLSSSGLSSGSDYWIYNNATNYWKASGAINCVLVNVSAYIQAPSLESNSNKDFEIVTSSGYGNYKFRLRSISENAFLVGSTEVLGATKDFTSNGTATITSIGHGWSVAIGDLVWISNASTAADKGYYRLVGFTNDTLVLDRALAGSDSDCETRVYKDVLGVFGTDGTNGQRIMNYNHQDKPLQLGGDILIPTTNLGSEDILIGNLLGLTNAAAVPGGACVNGTILYGKDSSDGAVNSTLAIYAEQAVEANGGFTASHKFKIWINGTEYWITLDAV